MLFLETRSGLLAADAVDLIESVCVRSTGNFHRIHYHIGSEARETTATEQAVANFLQETNA
jgi:diaminopimelate decarboxylase